MAQGTKQNVAPLGNGAETASACNVALAETCKALKAFSFYPESHPLRAKLLHVAYQAMAKLVRDGRVSLIVQRDGFAFADREEAIANSPMAAALAQELFTRELQGLTLQPDLSSQEFDAFLSLLATEPARLSAAGGLAAILKKRGIATITVNEIDISAVFNKKKVGESEDDAEAKGARAIAEPEPRQTRSELELPPDLNQPPAELTVDELLAKISPETDDDTYRQLARMLLAKGQPLRNAEEFDALYAILVTMAKHHRDSGRSQVQRDCSLTTLQQLISGKAVDHLLDHLDEEHFPHRESVYMMLVESGAEVVDNIVARLLTLGSRPSRKPLMTVLCRIGDPAAPALTNLLKDDRWQVVYTGVAVLGEIGNRDAVKSLSVTLLHPDKRVRMETIRALARIGGMEASNVLLELLHDPDHTVAIQAITWLGNTRNHRAVQPLLQLLAKTDLRGKLHNLKREAVTALGRIGDRRALDPLFKLVGRRFWIAPERGRQLKALAIEAIGNIGGDQARTFLEQMSGRRGSLGEASSAAMAAMVNRKTEAHE